MDLSELAKAALLGLVEGLTEFIPVSSTGHLILAGEALEFTGDKAKAFDVFIQLGAILSVVVLYRDRFVSLFRGAFPLTKWLRSSTYRGATGGLEGSSGLLTIGVSSIPALAAGALLHSRIGALFHPTSVAFALIFGGVVFLLVEMKRHQPTILSTGEITLKLGFLIGCFQALALWPGISRSGATLVGAMLLGVERRVAADFSFIIAVPIIAAAAILDFAKVAGTLTAADLTIFAAGLTVSFLAGIASISLLLSILKRYTLRPFGYYRILVGLLVLALTAS